MKNRITAAIFAIILGGIGVHRFYLGQTGMGIIYLLFCWTGIPALIGLIEGILMLTMTDNEFKNKYGVEVTSTFSFNSADTLLKYKKLYDEGVITLEEFEKKKKELL